MEHPTSTKELQYSMQGIWVSSSSRGTIYNIRTNNEDKVDFITKGRGDNEFQTPFQILQNTNRSLVVAHRKGNEGNKYTFRLVSEDCLEITYTHDAGIYNSQKIAKRVLESNMNEVSEKLFQDGCPRAIALSVLNYLKLDEVYFNGKHDKCYCSCHFSKFMARQYTQGNKKYVVPINCTMFGLSVDHVVEKQGIWNWPISYHGTTSKALPSILMHRQLLLPGDVLKDGTKLEIRAGHIPGQIYFYTSPSWRYSILPVYAAPFMVGKWRVQLVLKCLQQPESFKVQSETVGAGKRICPEIPNDKLEWYSNRRGTVVPFGLLVFINYS